MERWLVAGRHAISNLSIRRAKGRDLTRKMFMDDETTSESSSEEEAEVTTPVAERPKTSEVPYSRFKEVVDERNKLREELASAKKPQPVAQNEELATVKSELALLKFMQKGYSEDEAKLLLQTGENPVVLAGIESMRSKAKVEQGTPPPSPRVSQEVPQEAIMPGKAEPLARKSFLDKRTQEALDHAKKVGRLRVE